MSSRKYDIGHGVTVTDDGYSIRAEWKSGSGSTSIGIHRPKQLGEMVQVIMSRAGDMFYISDVDADCWMSVQEFETEDAAKVAWPAGIMGPSGYQFTEKDGSRTYFRRILEFSCWDVKSDPERKRLPKTELMIEDYLAVAQAKARAAEARFNDAIAFTGRNLKDIMEKIGDWVKPSKEPTLTI